MTETEHFVSKKEAERIGMALLRLDPGIRKQTVHALVDGAELIWEGEMIVGLLFPEDFPKETGD